MPVIFSVRGGGQGFGILEALIVVALIGTVTLGAGFVFQNMNLSVSNMKAQTGRDSVSAFLLSTMSDEAFCTSRLQMLPGNFSYALAKNPPGPANPHQPLIFSAFDPSMPPLGTSLLIYPQFNLIINQVYFADSGPPAIEYDPTTHFMDNVYQGEVWLSSSLPSPTGGPPTVLADRKITGTFYVWVVPATNTLDGCGILKMPCQTCTDDLGGVWDAVNSVCRDIPFPCAPGQYYLGPTATPKCINSAAACPVNQTVVSNGSGGTTCQPIP